MSKKIRLHIGGMTCVNCQNKIEKGLLRAKGVLRAGVSYNKAAADVVYDEKKTSLQEITGVIERLGYRVIPDGKAAGPGHCKDRRYAGGHNSAVCSAAGDRGPEPAGSGPTGGYRDGLRDALCHRPDHLGPLYRHVRRHQPLPVHSPEGGGGSGRDRETGRVPPRAGPTTWAVWCPIRRWASSLGWPVSWLAAVLRSACLPPCRAL